MHQNNYNDYRLQNNPPEENTCRDLYNESSDRVPKKMIWPNKPKTTMKNKRSYSTMDHQKLFSELLYRPEY